MKPNQKIGYRFEVCVICGRDWNVSRKLRLPREGYICPGCGADMRKLPEEKK